MMYLKENKMPREQLEAKLNSLHAKETTWKVLSICAFVLCFAMGCITGNVLVFLAFLAILVVFFVFWAKSNNEMKSFLSENVINDVLTELFGDTVEYKPFEKLNPGGVLVPFRYVESFGENYIKGVRSGVSFELGDITLYDKVEYNDGEDGPTTSRVTRLKGQWLICDMENAPACDVYVSELESDDRSILTSNVKSPDDRFSDRFCVRADDPQEAYKILTPQMMERISAAADKCAGTIYLSFLRSGKMNVAIKNEHVLFEPVKGKMNVDTLRNKFKAELIGFAEIIEMLCAKERNL